MSLKKIFSKEYVVQEKGNSSSSSYSLMIPFVASIILGITSLVLAHLVFNVSYERGDFDGVQYALILIMVGVMFVMSVGLFVISYSQVKKENPDLKFKELLFKNIEQKTHYIKIRYKDEVLKETLSEEKYNQINQGDKIVRYDLAVENIIPRSINVRARNLILSTASRSSISLLSYFLPESGAYLMFPAILLTGTRENFTKGFAFFVGVIAPQAFMFIHTNQLVGAILSGSIWHILAVVVTLSIVFFIHYKGIKHELARGNGAVIDEENKGN